jgi:Tol biopolymer transport system component
MNVSGLVRNGTQARSTRRALLASVTTLVLTTAACGQEEGVREAAPPTTSTIDAETLGIFEPFAGRIVYDRRCITQICPSGDPSELEIWGIDPAATDRAPTRLPERLGTPAGWSRDGTELLVISPEGGLIILHADGTETLLRGPMLPQGSGLLDAAISPDGSRVAYAATAADGLTSKLFAIDVGSGRATLLVEPNGLMVYQPSFSPDGSRIAYMDGGGDHSHAVWVVGADGSDPIMIVENEVTSEGHVFGLSWSPTGDLIALGLRRLPSAGIYTFAPDGSGFTRLIDDGLTPSWSPDGSQVAYDSYVMDPCSGTCWHADESGGLVVADADGSDARAFGVGGSGPWHPA